MYVVNSKDKILLFLLFLQMLLLQLLNVPRVCLLNMIMHFGSVVYNKNVAV